jgi:hypothetical protein
MPERRNRIHRGNRRGCERHSSRPVPGPSTSFPIPQVVFQAHLRSGAISRPVIQRPPRSRTLTGLARAVNDVFSGRQVVSSGSWSRPQNRGRAALRCAVSASSLSHGGRGFEPRRPRQPSLTVPASVSYSRQAKRRLLRRSREAAHRPQSRTDIWQLDCGRRSCSWPYAFPIQLAAEGSCFESSVVRRCGTVARDGGCIIAGTGEYRHGTRYREGGTRRRDSRRNEYDHRG